MADVDGGLSKSAKKRAAKKARDDSFADEQAAAAAATPAPKAKGKAKAAPAQETAQPKAKAKGKAAPEPVAPEPKAKAKAKSQPEAAPKAKAKAKADPAPPPPPPPAPAAKAQSKQKAKAKAAPAPVEEERPKERDTELINYFYDDKANDDSWEMAVSTEKKKLDRRKAQQVQAKDAKSMVNQKVVGGNFIEETPVKGQKGPSQNVAADVQRILAMKGEAEEQAEKPQGKALTSTSVNVPENRIGVVIGPKGANVQLLQEKTKTKIDTSSGVFTITGEADAVLDCEKAIQDLVSKGYCALMYEGFTENVLSVHPSCFPDLIGKEGKIVRKIKEELKVEVNFQDVPKGSAPSKKGKVSLAGKAEDVEKAKDVINKIMTEQHHELTHPGLVHETVDIEPWAYRYIIGKAGSELKHIQHNWRVKVSIPRDNSPFEQVLVVGEPDQVMRAKAYIDKLVWNAENNAKGRDRQDGTAADPWGEEEDEEPWMKQYMYKRN